MKKLTENEYKALLLCQDNIGLTCLIAGELGIIDKGANKLMEGLLKRGFVTKEQSIKTKKGRLLNKGEKGYQFWYDLTPLGKKRANLCFKTTTA